MATNRNSDEYEPIIKVNPITIVLLFVGLIMVVALVIGIKAWSDSLHADKQLTVSNLSSKIQNMPGSAKKRVQQALYQTARVNIPYDQEVPTTGAKVRESQTVTSLMDRDTNVYFAHFIVDIESLEQSHDVQVEWVVDTAYEKNLSGYPVQIGCVGENDKIYKNFDCTDIQSANGIIDGNTLVTAYNSAGIPNMVKLNESGMTDGAYNKLYRVIIQYFGSMYGDVRLSLDKTSFVANEGKYEFDLISVEKNKYHCFVETEGQDFKLKISNNGDELYSYDSSIFVSPKRNPLSLDKRYLPHYGTTAKTRVDYTFNKRIDDEYEISINACKKQSIKDEALTEVADWLENLGYDINDFNVKMPDYCDGGAH